MKKRESNPKKALKKRRALEKEADQVRNTEDYPEALARIAAAEFDAGIYQDAALTYEIAADEAKRYKNNNLESEYRNLAGKIRGDITPYKKGERTLGSYMSHLRIASAVLAIVFSIFFFAANITGNVIGNLTQNTSSGIGVVLLVLGVIVLFIHNKKNNPQPHK